MAESYKISAIPLLYLEGPHQGRLNGVTFTAICESDKKEWFVINAGQFEEVFLRLMPRRIATIMVAALMEGDEIELPGLYRPEQFIRGFHYEWSGPHFVRPVRIRLEELDDYAQTA